MERIKSKRKDIIKSKVWQPTGTETQDPNVISMVENILKQVESMMTPSSQWYKVTQNRWKQLLIRYLNLNWRSTIMNPGYVPPKPIKIENNQSDAQSNSQWSASWTGAQNNPQKKKLLELNQDVIDEIGVEGARKWHRDDKQQKYMKSWRKTEKRTRATEKRLQEARAKG